MSASENDLDTPLPSLALRRFAWGTLAYFIATILWGTVVRATGSGAGCGEHWPLCNGTVLQAAPSVQTMIEFAHRITSGLDGGQKVVVDGSLLLFEGAKVAPRDAPKGAS